MPVTNILAAALDNLKRKSPYIQIAVGAGVGFAAGYVFFKCTKMLAICVGSAILTIELAVQSGLIRLDVTPLVGNGSAQEGSNVQSGFLQSENQMRLIHKAKKLISSSARISVAFLGGFMIGFGFS